MPSSDRPDALAPADADAPDLLPVVAEGEVEARNELNPAPTESSSPDSDDSEPVALGPAQPAHELLEKAPDAANGERGKPEPAATQLVSGDPLLRAPEAANVEVPSKPPPRPPKPPKPPPPSDPSVKRAMAGTALASQATSSTTAIPGTSSPTTDQPARRASRGAHVATSRAATPPTRPPAQPVATLRPTTVAPVPRLAGRRPRVRRVTRVVRHVDPWSVFKVAAAFSVVSYAIALVAGVLLWNVAYATGTIDNIERGMESTGWEVFELDGGEIFHNAWIGGLFGAVAMTGLAVLVATLFNLITDLVGGIRLTVLEEEVVEKTASPMRRFATSPGRQGPPHAESPSSPQGAEARVRRARGG
ncbi:MAG: hypothetical protein K0S92_17 [Desertimonas sp.]|nr:hypothetical protein [Desertimonas sp.]